MRRRGTSVSNLLIVLGTLTRIPNAQPLFGARKRCRKVFGQRIISITHKTIRQNTYPNPRNESLQHTFTPPELLVCCEPLGVTKKTATQIFAPRQFKSEFQ